MVEIFRELADTDRKISKRSLLWIPGFMGAEQFSVRTKLLEVELFMVLSSETASPSVQFRRNPRWEGKLGLAFERRFAAKASKGGNDMEAATPSL